jgi:hypothetical protein
LWLVNWSVVLANQSVGEVVKEFHLDLGDAAGLIRCENNLVVELDFNVALWGGGGIGIRVVVVWVIVGPVFIAVRPGVAWLVSIGVTRNIGIWLPLIAVRNGSLIAVRLPLIARRCCVLSIRVAVRRYFVARWGIGLAVRRYFVARWGVRVAVGRYFVACRGVRCQGLFDGEYFRTCLSWSLDLLGNDWFFRTGLWRGSKAGKQL